MPCSCTRGKHDVVSEVWYFQFLAREVSPSRIPHSLFQSRIQCRDVVVVVMIVVCPVAVVVMMKQ